MTDRCPYCRCEAPVHTIGPLRAATRDEVILPRELAFEACDFLAGRSDDTARPVERRIREALKEQWSWPERASFSATMGGN